MAPVFGKNFVSDQLMLVFTEADRFVDEVKRNELAEFERLADGGAEVATDDRPPSWHTRLMGYSAPAETLRFRLDLQGFSSERVQSLCIAFFDEELARDTEDDGIDLRDSWPEGQTTYPDGAAVTAALTSRRGQAVIAEVPRDRIIDHERRFLEHQWESLRESFDDPRFALALSLVNTRPATTVTLDLTDLVLGGWMNADDKPHQTPVPGWPPPSPRADPSLSSPRAKVMRGGYAVPSR